MFRRIRKVMKKGKNIPYPGTAGTQGPGERKVQLFALTLPQKREILRVANDVDGMGDYVLDEESQPWRLKAWGDCLEHTDSNKAGTRTFVLMLAAQGPYTLTVYSNRGKVHRATTPIAYKITMTTPGDYFVFDSCFNHVCHSAADHKRIIVNVQMVRKQ